MICVEAREKLREALGAGLPPESGAAAHTAACEGCRRYAADLAAVFSALRAPAPERTAADWARFNNAVHAALPARPAALRSRRRARAWRIAPAAAAALALLLLLLNPTPVTHHAPPRLLTTQSADESAPDMVAAVYSDYDFYQDVGGVSQPESDESRQAWSAQRLLRSGSPIENEVAPDLQELTPDEAESINRRISRDYPGLN